jgi:hypothetical protein
VLQNCNMLSLVCVLFGKRREGEKDKDIIKDPYVTKENPTKLQS